MKRYTDRPKTAYEHAWEIRAAYGFRAFEDALVGEEFRRFLDGRAWTHAEAPAALFEQAVGWLRRHRVLIPVSRCSRGWSTRCAMLPRIGCTPG